LFQKTENHAKTALIDIRRKLEDGVVPGSSFPEYFQKKKISDLSRRTQEEIENSNIWELIIDNMPKHWEDAVEAARNLQSYAVNERDTEVADRKAKRDKEKAEKNQNQELDEGDKKIKTKMVTSTDDKGWTHQKVVDKEGKELEKSKPDVVTPKPKKTVTAGKIVNEKSNPSTNIYDLPEDAENVPSKAEYISSVRDSRLKGKVDKTPVKQKASKASQEKEKKEPKSEKKADKKQPKSEKKEKVKKSPEEKKQIVADVPFWQNELFKPLVYVFGIVSLLSFLYLVLN